MLDRLISEERLRLEEVPAKEFPVDLRQADPRPDPLEFAQSLAYVERHRREVFRPGFSIVCLVYKSAEWARFVYEQVLRYTDMSDKEFFFVANDASDEVLAFLRANYIPHVEWNNSEAQRSEWYINNVYRAYNFGAHQARGDLLVFINTDMAFSPGWFEALWEGYDGASAVASRLVESGKLRTGEHGIEKDFGTTPADYREQDLVEFAQDIRELTVVEGGLYMPLMVRRDTFLSVGGYPEGNPQPGGDIFNPRMASQGEPCISGDNVMIQRLASRGVRHRTACDSVAYHFQMGEKDTAGGAHNTDGPLVAICNDLVTGTMGERVLWDFLLEGLPSTIGIDSRVVGTDGRYASLAHAYINEQCPGVEVIIQNATFIDAVDPARFTIAFLQDDLRAMGRDSSQQEKNLRVARATVTNSLLAAMSYPECEFTIIPVGVDSDLFRPMDKLACRALYGLSEERVGIFVGAFDDVKGWPAVRQCIQTFPEIIWLLVTKKDESFEAANARTFRRVPQDRLVTLLNSADFFILGSPVETQCLAAIEACLCDVPVVMRSTGIFNELSNDERRQAGVFGEDLIAGVGAVAGGTFSPRDLVVRQGWTVNDSVAKWRVLLEHAVQEATSERVGFVGQTTVNEQGELAYKERCEWRPNYVPAPAGQSTAAASLSEEAAGSVEEAAGIRLELQAQKLRRNVERLVGARPAGLVLSLIHSVSWTIRPLRHRLARRRHRVR
jgi:glycosyltransferase involved in cell wall biosynthesis